MRLKTGIWVSALIRRLDGMGLAVAVVKKGDSDGGAVLLKLNRMAAGVTVLAQTRTREGDPAWMAGTGQAPVAEDQADAYIGRARDRDPDLWVVEIEDPKGLFRPDEKII
jgi:hypothetical protein